MMGLMSWRWGKSYLRVLCALACLTIPNLAMASENHGQVTFGDLPVPGATITATQGSKKFIAISDEEGRYSFPDLPDGAWKIEITMTGFATIDQVVTVSSNTPSSKWELKLLPLDQVLAQIKVRKTAQSVTAKLPDEPAKSEAPKA